LVIGGVYYIYKQLVNNRHLVLERFTHLPLKQIASVIIVYNLIMILISLKYVVNSDSSRIEYMTASWFSYFKPITMLLGSLCFIVPIFLLGQGKKKIATIIIALTILANILGGSKASFVLGIITALLIYKDFNGTHLVTSKLFKYNMVAGIFIITLFAFSRLNVGIVDIGSRLVLTGEGTIMVYYSNEPTLAAVGLTTAAKIHRGIAKFLGDKSAANIDTLFGFALSIVHYGENTFTGPNSSIPAYMLCNYQGMDNIIGVLSILGYFLIIRFFLKALVIGLNFKSGVIFFPFVIDSITTYPQDYYTGMANVTVIFEIILFLILVKIVGQFTGDSCKTT
jgi:hypothetical protein